MQVAEGFDELDMINDAFVDDNNRPLQNIRIRHTQVLEDPFPDPPQLTDYIPEKSPEPEFAAEVHRRHSLLISPLSSDGSEQCISAIVRIHQMILCLQASSSPACPCQMPTVCTVS